MAGPPPYPDSGITGQDSGPPPLAAGFVLVGRRDA